MSYNISSVDTLTLDAWISETDRARLVRELADELPEQCFLTERKALAASDTAGMCKLRRFSWSDTYSGHSYGNGTFEQVARCIKGRIEAVMVWEGGDSMSGLRIVNGVWTQPAVVHALEAE